MRPPLLRGAARAVGQENLTDRMDSFPIPGVVENEVKLKMKSFSSDKRE